MDGYEHEINLDWYDDDFRTGQIMHEMREQAMADRELDEAEAQEKADY